MSRAGARDADGATIVYGRRPVAEAKRGRRRVRRVWTTDDLPASELTRLAGSSDHQGFVAEVDPYPYAEPGSLLEHPEALVVALDQVQDPRNLGAVCRSAEAAGAAGVVIPSRRSASVTAVACKASAGAVEHLRVARVPNLADWLGQAKESGAWVYGAETSARAVYTQADLSGMLVLVLGSEAKGLRPRVSESCDLLVSIPVGGRVASLNVSAAAAVLLFEAARQRGGGTRTRSGPRGRKRDSATKRAPRGEGG
jgi:23S rRNA (guanosine2251-2'-O)-methyltransferase